MSTLNEINNMTDEEVAALNEELGKKLLKRAALKVAITSVVLVAAHVLVKKLEEKGY